TLTAFGYPRYGSDREDLLQEIRIRIWKSLRDNERQIQYFDAYLRKIVYSVFINEINRVQRENELLQKSEARLNAGDGADRNAPEEAALRDVLAASIDDLKEAKQQVLKLRLEGFTLNEIARLNQWPYRKTCSIFYRGLKDLKRKLGERGVHYED
ncbi:MAG TPA: sigma-70 family RNA polymerase sigma factor, partial [Terriglobales bacterium]|nr:sigma-70 family RNA polymerase sigma factor [Terriglobales bacterium]